VNLKVGGALLCLAGALAALVPLFAHGSASETEVAIVQRLAPDYLSTFLIWSAAVIVLGIATAYVATRKSAKAALAVAAPASGVALVRLIQLPSGDLPMVGFDRMLAIVSLVAIGLGGVLLLVAQAKPAKETAE